MAIQYDYFKATLQVVHQTYCKCPYCGQSTFEQVSDFVNSVQLKAIPAINSKAVMCVHCGKPIEIMVLTTIEGVES